jgi:hypothetical protein
MVSSIKSKMTSMMLGDSTLESLTPHVNALNKVILKITSSLGLFFILKFFFTSKCKLSTKESELKPKNTIFS